MEVNMKKISALCVSFAVLAGCSSTSGVLPVGGGQYMITSESEFSAAEIHKNAIVEANNYCISKNKELEVLRTETGDAGIGAFARKNGLSLTFRCL